MFFVTSSSVPEVSRKIIYKNWVSAIENYALSGNPLEDIEEEHTQE